MTRQQASDAVTGPCPDSACVCEVCHPERSEGPRSDSALRDSSSPSAPRNDTVSGGGYTLLAGEGCGLKRVTSQLHIPGARTGWLLLPSAIFVLLFARLSLAQTPEAAGQAQAPRASSAASNPCARASAVYIHIATETGGLPWFLQRSEASKVSHFMRESSGTIARHCFGQRGRSSAPRLTVSPFPSTRRSNG